MVGVRIVFVLNVIDRHFLFWLMVEVGVGFDSSHNDLLESVGFDWALDSGEVDNLQEKGFALVCSFYCCCNQPLHLDIVVDYCSFVSNVDCWVIDQNMSINF